MVKRSQILATLSLLSSLVCFYLTVSIARQDIYKRGSEYSDADVSAEALNKFEMLNNQVTQKTSSGT
jgi:hypothetical protein